MADDGPWNKFQDTAPAGPWDKFTPGKIPQVEQMGAGEQFFAGATRPVRGGAQLIAHLVRSPEEAQKVDTAVKAREQQITNRGGYGLPGAIGEMVATAPAMAAGPLGPILGGAVGGGLAAASAPVTGGNYWAQKGADVIMGSAFGAGTSAVLQGISTALGPGKEASELLKSGVQLTPGQLMGGTFRRAEEAFKSFPILGSFIRGAEGRGIEGFNRGVYNQVLEPLQGIPGVQAKIDPSLKGYDAINFVSGQFDKAYSQTLKGMKLQIDHDLGQDISDIRFRSDELGPDLQKQFNTILVNRLSPVFKGATDVKTSVRDIQSFADQYRRSSSASEQRMAGMFDEVKQSLLRAVERQNPQQADQLRNIDKGYAMFARARDAAVRRPKSEGVFTPNDLLQAVKSQDKSRGKSRFATGDDLLQVYARYGQKVLPGELPDSGTTERALWDAAGIAIAIKQPMIPLGLAAASVPYTKVGGAAVNALAKSGAGQKAAPYIGTAVAPQVLRTGKAQQQEEPQYGGPQQ